MYEKICSYENLFLAYKKARKGKTKKRYVKRFERNLVKNLLNLQKQLLAQTYNPFKLKKFIIRDPKTRKISKSAFKDRIIHHALINIIGPIFEKSFIYDSHANQIGKGTLKAIERFDKFKRKVSKNNTRKCHILKADIKHYFDEVNHEILIKILNKKIPDNKTIWLINKILDNGKITKNKGMPLGNLTSQFFANIYLNELDYFIKCKLKVKYYIRYVDDFVILSNSKTDLNQYREIIISFLKEKLDLTLHDKKTRLINLKKGITFLGLRIYYYHKLLKKSNMKNFDLKFSEIKLLYKYNLLTRNKTIEIFEGWLAYASHANSFKYKKKIIKEFNRTFPAEKSNKKLTKTEDNFIKKIKESQIKFSVQKTLFLYKKGLTIQEISNKRGIKESTVWNHIVNLIQNKQIHINRVLSKIKLLAILSKIQSKSDTLKEIKSRIKNDAASYNDVACVMAWMNREPSTTN